MNSTLFMVAAGMRSRVESLDILGNNIANASTSGYKADHEFNRLFWTERARSDPYNGAESLMPVAEATRIDFTQGPLIATEAPLDVALNGRGFLAVDGPGSVLYTRNGHLTRAADGRLVTADGYAVRDSGGGPITVPEHGRIEIEPHGVVSVDGLTIGQLAIVEFAGQPPLTKVGRNYFSAPVQVTPEPTGATTLAQGHLEGSNVSAPEAAVRLISVGRHFEMLSRVANLVGNEMDARSVEELGRTR
jgi:flagellar basal body rod protein FlgG